MQATADSIARSILHVHKQDDQRKRKSQRSAASSFLRFTQTRKVPTPNKTKATGAINETDQTI